MRITSLAMGLFGRRQGDLQAAFNKRSDHREALPEVWNVDIHDVTKV